METPTVRRALTLALCAALVPACEPASPGAGSGSDPAATGAGPGVTVEGLGTTYFATSGAEEARAPFHRGVLLLHSFEYADARAAFDSARALDPDFAMAYWGEAMTHNHPLWRQQDREAARAALRELAPTPEERLAKAGTERERAYLQAVETLFGDGPKARRDTLYARAMGRLVERFPRDPEAKALHALSLLGLSGGDRHVPTYMDAGARALGLFHEHPGHPGAVHYAIHSFDDPAHAPLGLGAARAYAEIAPGADHAQHMTSHIFLALGHWSRVVEANEAAARTVARERGYRGELHPCGHYAEWLAYGYLQQGRSGAARDLILACHETGGGSGDGAPGSVARIRAHYLVDADPPAPEVAGLAPEGGSMAMEWRLARDFGDGLSALGQGDVGAARRVAERLQGRVAGEREGLVADARVLALGLRALAARETGDLEAALERAREAAEVDEAQPVPFGPPASYKPPRELEGEILLALDRPDEAVAAFHRALERTPRRPASLEGLARAAEAAGHEEVARRARAQLREIRGSEPPGDEGAPSRDGET